MSSAVQNESTGEPQKEPRHLPPLVENPGTSVVGAARATGLFCSVVIGTLYSAIRHRSEKGTVRRAMYRIAGRSFFFVTAAMSLIGTIVVYLWCVRGSRIAGDPRIVGAAFLQVVVRDLAATIGGILVAVRSGALVAGEVASVVVADRASALGMRRADSAGHPTVPWFEASLVVIPALIAWSMAVLVGIGILAAWVMCGVSPEILWNTSMLDYGDLTIALTKCIGLAAAIPIVSGYCGIAAAGGPEGASRATTRAALWSVSAAVLVNFAASLIGFYFFPA